MNKLNDNLKFASKLRFFRNKHRLSQVAFATICGVSYITYGGVERGATCSKKTEDKITSGMNYYESDLFNSQDMPSMNEEADH